MSDLAQLITAVSGLLTGAAALITALHTLRRRNDRPDPPDRT